MKEVIEQGSVSKSAKTGGPAGRGRSIRFALALLRITLGALFVWVYFENKGKGLYTPGGYAGLIGYYVNSGAAPAAWKSVMNFAASHAETFGPIQAMTEIGFGITLVVGLLTRPIALGAFLFLTSLWVSEWGTAWIWELLVPMMVALALAIASAGRDYGVDVLLAKKFPRLPLW